MGISKSIVDHNSGKIKRVGNYAHVKKFRLWKKQKLVELFGGKCCVCGYCRTFRNLGFHHVDPSTKAFSVSTGGLGHGLGKLIEEAKKCIMVCANCHGEIHEKLIDARLYFAPLAHLVEQPLDKR